MVLSFYASGRWSWKQRRYHTMGRFSRVSAHHGSRWSIQHVVVFGVKTGEKEKARHQASSRSCFFVSFFLAYMADRPHLSQNQPCLSLPTRDQLISLTPGTSTPSIVIAHWGHPALQQLARHSYFHAWTVAHTISTAVILFCASVSRRLLAVLV